MDSKSCVSQTATRKRQPRKTKKTIPIRRSARLQDRLTQEKKAQDNQVQPPTVGNPSDQKRKQPSKPSKRGRLIEKLQRPCSATAESAHEDESVDSDADSTDAIDYWRKHLRWPQWYLKAEDMVKLRATRARPKTKRSAPTLESAVDYKESEYHRVLARKNVFMEDDPVGLSDEMRQRCEDFFKREGPEPQNTLFDSDIHQATCRMVRLRNEARLFRDITMLLVPSVEILTMRLPPEERILLETTNELWTDVIPMTFPRPQPDYGVGFQENAFTKEQFQKLQQFIGTIKQESYFKTVSYIYFPFFTCEVKCGKEGLLLADRQAAHAGAIAVRAVVELFRLVKREKELNREILAFSVSHNEEDVRIYGYYPVIDGKDMQVYRHDIDKFNFQIRNGSRRWDTYKFTRNIYDKWVPEHLERIRSAIDLIPFDMVSTSSDDDEYPPTSEDPEGTRLLHAPKPRSKPRAKQKQKASSRRSSRLSQVQNADEIGNDDGDDDDDDDDNDDDEYTANSRNADTDLDGDGPRRSKRVKTKK